MKKIYKNIIEAKNGSLIPVFLNEKPMHSKYNPENEGNVFASEIPSGTNYIVILGVGGGYHIKATAERFPDSIILAIENSREDLQLVSTISCVKELLQNKNILCQTADNEAEILNTLKQTYIPTKYGNLYIDMHRAWAESTGQTVKKIKDIIKNALDEITADYSTQSRFGKIWQHNILSNLFFFDAAIKSGSKQINGIIHMPVEKTAAIIAAGPSFDKTLSSLKKNRDSYYVIATDTAFSSLAKQHIASDAVVSIDGQCVSHTHFMEKISKETLFVFDVCANPSAVRRAFEAGCKILFFQTGHPLSALASPFLNLTSGAGTVTITAADFARKSGFKKIKTFGADFSYSNGKSYTKGTYLESQFESTSNRLNPSELQYDKLMYRTELLVKDELRHIYTTRTLDAYRNSFNVWEKTAPQEKIELKNPSDFDFSNFFDKNILLDNHTTALLPYAAFLRRNPAYKNASFTEILKLAHSAFLRYNFSL